MRILKFLGWSLALLLLVAAIVLVPPQLQLRSVHTPLLPAAAFAGLQRTDGPSALYYINTSEQQLEDSLLGHSVFVLEWPDGKLFLIDAGMREAQAIEFGELLESVMRGGPVSVQGTISTLLGEDAVRVAGMGFTHLHSDHTDGVHALCADGDTAPTLLQTPFQRDEHNLHTRAGARLLGESCLRASELEEGALLGHGEFPGLGLLPLGGHTPGSTLFAAWVDDHLFLFSGDITNSKLDLLEDRGKGWIYSYLLVPEDTGRTRELRHWLRAMAQRTDTTVVVSHDLEDIRAIGLREWH